MTIDHRKLLPFMPSHKDHKRLSVLAWLIAIALWPITIAIVLSRLAMRINQPALRYSAFALIAFFTLFNGVVWAAMYSATNSNQSQQSSPQPKPSKPTTVSTAKPPTIAPKTVVTPPSQPPAATPAPAPTAVASSCDASLWNHIYHSYRLTVLQQCTTVTGTIDHIIHEKDGDTHIRLKLDPAFASMLNSKNMSAQYGDLVLEPVCEETPTQSDAISACAGYQSNVVVPGDGSHVSVTGSYVLDTDHGWNEIHPVTSITVTQ